MDRLNCWLFSSCILLCIGLAMGFRVPGTTQFYVGLNWRRFPQQQHVCSRNQKLRLSMTAGSVFDAVIDVVAEQLGVDKEKVQPQSNFIKDLGADSLDSVELVMAFEDKFGVSIPDDEATKITTVEQAVNYIDKAKGSALLVEA